MASDADYAKEHKLKELFEFLMEQVLNRKSSNPEGFMINLLQRRQNMKTKTSSNRPSTPQKASSRPASSQPKSSRPASSLSKSAQPATTTTTTASKPKTSRPSTAQPTASKISPRSKRDTNYDRPWMSKSSNTLHKSVPMIKTAKTLDLTVSSREANFMRTVKHQDRTSEAKQEVNKISKRVTNQALQVGKRNYVVDESEEIKLKFDKDFDTQMNSQPPQINAKEKMDLHRAKKMSANEMRSKAVQKNLANSQKPVLQLNVAEEIPVPKEYPKLENPFDLQTEGVTLTKEQLNQAKHFEDARHEKLKVDMDAMINKLSKSNRTSQMNDFLDHDQNMFVSPPASTRSLVSVSALETREWKMTDAF